MGRKYADRWWSIDVPAGWQARLEDDCSLFASEQGVGRLQAKALRSAGRDIEDDDLEELADHHAQGGASLFRVRYGTFSGFYVHYRAEADLWYEWWLRSGKVALHATYHCPVEARAVEEATVAAILGSLQLVEAEDAG